jgi:hypothetical protein
MVIASAMLTASSTLPMSTLTTALPSKRRMSGDSYTLLANLSQPGSFAATANSFGPCRERRDGMTRAVRPEVRDV